MKKQAEYLEQIAIEALWGRKDRDITWRLRPDVTILSGSNGSGKPTILNHAVRHLRNNIPGVHLTFYPADATHLNYSLIRSFDRPLMNAGLADQVADEHITTELDWQIYQLQRRYLDYQVKIGNRIIDVLSTGAPDAGERAADLSRPKRMFQDMLDHLFSETGKRVVRSSNEIAFTQVGETLLPHQLSAGEQQMLVFLLFFFFVFPLLC